MEQSLKQFLTKKMPISYRVFLVYFLFSGFTPLMPGFVNVIEQIQGVPERESPALRLE